MLPKLNYMILLATKNITDTTSGNHKKTREKLRQESSCLYMDVFFAQQVSSTLTLSCTS